MRLKLIRVGDVFTLAINGTNVFTFTDTIWNGEVEVGLRAHGTESYERATWAQLISEGAVIEGDSNPWLAGMPAGTPDFPGNGDPTPDLAPAQSPLELTGLTLLPGQLLSFSADGMVHVSGNAGTTGPDGNASNVTSHGSGPQYGIANVQLPANGLVGVFLEDGQPDQYTAPGALDFSTQASRDYHQLSPELRQPFFIGDGLTSGGQLQQIAVPDGATRLFLGTMDGSDWQDNTGFFNVTVTVTGMIEGTTVLGDLNGDGSVNGQDLAILAANFGLTGQTLATGDVTGDGNVNGQDLAILAANFGASGDIATATNPDSGSENPPAEPARPMRDAPLTLTRDQQRAAAAAPRRANALALATPVAKNAADTTRAQTDNAHATTPDSRPRRFNALALR